MSHHPWHGVPTGKQSPHSVNSIIEISKGTNSKYELDKESGLLRLDRVLYSAMFYPANYGFIPRTLGKDHDPLDIVVLSQIDVVPLCLVEAKVIGVMRMVDGGEADDKIIAVAENDISVNYINDIVHLPAHLINELRNFFEEYKKLEHKEVIVQDFQGPAIAKEIIGEAVKDYKEKYK